jgi:hypothetical protein
MGWLGIPRRLLGLAERSEDGAPADGMDEHVASSQREWLRTRRLLNQHRPELTQFAAALA